MTGSSLAWSQSIMRGSYYACNQIDWGHRMMMLFHCPEKSSRSNVASVDAIIRATSYGQTETGNEGGEEREYFSTFMLLKASSSS